MHLFFSRNDDVAFVSSNVAELWGVTSPDGTERSEGEDATDRETTLSPDSVVETAKDAPTPEPAQQQQEEAGAGESALSNDSTSTVSSLRESWKQKEQQTTPSQLLNLNDFHMQQRKDRVGDKLKKGEAAQHLHSFRNHDAPITKQQTKTAGKQIPAEQTKAADRAAMAQYMFLRQSKDSTAKGTAGGTAPHRTLALKTPAPELAPSTSGDRSLSPTDDKGATSSKWRPSPTGGKSIIVTDVDEFYMEQHAIHIENERKKREILHISDNKQVSPDMTSTRPSDFVKSFIPALADSVDDDDSLALASSASMSVVDSEANPSGNGGGLFQDKEKQPGGEAADEKAEGATKGESNAASGMAAQFSAGEDDVGGAGGDSLGIKLENDEEVIPQERAVEMEVRDEIGQTKNEQGEEAASPLNAADQYVADGPEGTTDECSDEAQTAYDEDVGSLEKSVKQEAVNETEGNSNESMAEVQGERGDEVASPQETLDGTAINSDDSSLKIQGDEDEVISSHQKNDDEDVADEAEQTNKGAIEVEETVSFENVVDDNVDSEKEEIGDEAIVEAQFIDGKECTSRHAKPVDDGIIDEMDESTVVRSVPLPLEDEVTTLNQESVHQDSNDETINNDCDVETENQRDDDTFPYQAAVDADEIIGEDPVKVQNAQEEDSSLNCENDIDLDGVNGTENRTTEEVAEIQVKEIGEFADRLSPSEVHDDLLEKPSEDDFVAVEAEEDNGDESTSAPKDTKTEASDACCEPTKDSNVADDPGIHEKAGGKDTGDADNEAHERMSLHSRDQQDVPNDSAKNDIQLETTIDHAVEQDTDVAEPVKDKDDKDIVALEEEDFVMVEAEGAREEDAQRDSARNCEDVSSRLYFESVDAMAGGVVVERGETQSGIEIEAEAKKDEGARSEENICAEVIADHQDEQVPRATQELDGFAISLDTVEEQRISSAIEDNLVLRIDPESVASDVAAPLEDVELSEKASVSRDESIAFFATSADMVEPMPDVTVVTSSEDDLAFKRQGNETEKRAAASPEMAISSTLPAATESISETDADMAVYDENYSKRDKCVDEESNIEATGSDEPLEVDHVPNDISDVSIGNDDSTATVDGDFPVESELDSKEVTSLDDESNIEATTSDEPLEVGHVPGNISRASTCDDDSTATVDGDVPGEAELDSKEVRSKDEESNIEATPSDELVEMDHVPDTISSLTTGNDNSTDTVDGDVPGEAELDSKGIKSADEGNNIEATPSDEVLEVDNVPDDISCVFTGNDDSTATVDGEDPLENSHEGDDLSATPGEKFESISEDLGVVRPLVVDEDPFTCERDNSASEQTTGAFDEEPSQCGVLVETTDEIPPSISEETPKSAGLYDQGGVLSHASLCENVGADDLDSVSSIDGPVQEPADADMPFGVDVEEEDPGFETSNDGHDDIGVCDTEGTVEAESVAQAVLPQWTFREDATEKLVADELKRDLLICCVDGSIQLSAAEGSELEAVAKQPINEEALLDELVPYRDETVSQSPANGSDGVSPNEANVGHDAEVPHGEVVLDELRVGQHGKFSQPLAADVTEPDEKVLQRVGANNDTDSEADPDDEAVLDELLAAEHDAGSKDDVPKETNVDNSNGGETAPDDEGVLDELLASRDDTASQLSVEEEDDSDVSKEDYTDAEAAMEDEAGSKDYVPKKTHVDNSNVVGESAPDDEGLLDKFLASRGDTASQPSMVEGNDNDVSKEDYTDAEAAMEDELGSKDYVPRETYVDESNAGETAPDDEGVLDELLASRDDTARDQPSMEEGNDNDVSKGRTDAQAAIEDIITSAVVEELLASSDEIASQPSDDENEPHVTSKQVIVGEDGHAESISDESVLENRDMIGSGEIAAGAVMAKPEESPMEPTSKESEGPENGQPESGSEGDEAAQLIDNLLADEAALDVYEETDGDTSGFDSVQNRKAEDDHSDLNDVSAIYYASSKDTDDMLIPGVIAHAVKAGPSDESIEVVPKDSKACSRVSSIETDSSHEGALKLDLISCVPSAGSTDKPVAKSPGAKVEVDYKNADYRGFVFVVHKTYGLMLLYCTRKKKKGPHFQLPGGHIDEPEFFAAAEESRDGQTQLLQAARAGAARELYEETGMDMRHQLDRLEPAALRNDVEFDKHGKPILKNELKHRLYFFLPVSDDDFWSSVRHGILCSHPKPNICSIFF